jgi:TrmH family RNA methyltransferase
MIMMNNSYNDLILSSVQNDRVKQWASLLDKKFRDRTGQFLIEGVHLILEALKGGAAVSAIVYDAERGLPQELAEQRQRLNAGGGEGIDSQAADSARIDRSAGSSMASVEWLQASRAVMAKCSGTDTPPPVFAVVGKLEFNQAALYANDKALVVVLDGVRDPGNAGTIIRSADAAGADAVVLGRGCVDLYNPKTVRSTMGSLFHLPIIEADLQALLPEARAKGATLVGTSLQATHTCYGYDWTQATWLLLGNESEGLSAAAAAHVDETVIIPMAGQAESLNVAMAGTILLFESLRQRGFNK